MSDKIERCIIVPFRDDRDVGRQMERLLIVVPTEKLSSRNFSGKR